MIKLLLLSALLLLKIPAIKAQEHKRDFITDIDGNVYQTVVIGNYKWMAENLKTTTYNDGMKIFYITENNAWSGLSCGAYCWYNNCESNESTYGALYNWFAVNTGNLCPDGWRVPSDEEWKYLEGFVDSQYGVGDSIWNKMGLLRGYNTSYLLKATSGWISGGNGIDSFGFSAIPGGERLISDGRFFLIERNGFWWSSTEYGVSEAWFRSMAYSFEKVSRNSHDRRFGFSVRCLTDN